MPFHMAPKVDEDPLRAGVSKSMSGRERKKIKVPQNVATSCTHSIVEQWHRFIKLKSIRCSPEGVVNDWNAFLVVQILVLYFQFLVSILLYFISKYNFFLIKRSGTPHILY